MQNGRRSESSQDPAEGHDDVTPPERGFPGGDEDRADGGILERIEKAEDDDANPLAPPVNIQAGSSSKGWKQPYRLLLLKPRLTGKQRVTHAPIIQQGLDRGDLLE